MMDAPGRMGLKLFVAFFLFFTLLGHGYIENPDAEVEYQTARSLVLRGGTGLSGSHADASASERYLCSMPKPFDLMQGRDGKWYSWFGVGHALSLAPFYALGRGLGAILPRVERRYALSWEKDRGAVPEAVAQAFGEEFWARLLVSLHSPLFGALLCLVLFRILGHLGFGMGTCLLGVLAAALCSQFGPETRESMADTTTAFFLFAAIERVLSGWRGGAPPRAFWIAGLLGGYGFLCRPFLVLPLFFLGIFLLLASADRGGKMGGRFLLLAPGRIGWKPALLFALGLLPFGLFQLWFNFARFGNPLELGYSAGTSEGYWSFPFHLGFFFLGWSFGKGVFFFSPLLWLAPLAWNRLRRRESLLAFSLLGVFLSPWILSSFMTGWHSSQAWGVRYLTPMAAFFSALTVASLSEQGGPRLKAGLASLALLGLLAQAGGWLTPYHGFYDLAFRSAARQWPEVPAGNRIHLIATDLAYSPLHGHWTYALLSAQGRIPEGRGPEVYKALFGRPFDLSPRPGLPEDSSFRHFWWKGLGIRLDSSLPSLLAWLLLALLLYKILQIRALLASVLSRNCR
ncbi:MAG TPA: hypothetical protein ENK02_00860 [Planctomycetes bacterium]|nr:hypothetical protein [Planctomycetota bacterium]